MKVLHISTFDRYGAAIASIRLHKALLNQGIDSYILFLDQNNFSIPKAYVYQRYPGKQSNYLERQFDKIVNKFLPRIQKRYQNDLKVKNRPSGYEMFSFNPSDYDITTQKIYKDADIIHLNWVSGFVDYRFFRKNSKPVIWTLHDMNPFTGGCHYSNQCEKYKSECDNCPQLQGTINIHNALSDQEYKRKHLDNQNIIIVSPSDWLKACSLESKLFNKYEHRLVRNCLDFSIFRPLDKRFCRDFYNLPQDSSVLLFISDSIENKRKGFDILLEALPKINVNNIHICAIGEIKDNISYPSNISFLGRIDDERLMAIAYSAADIFILPSREDNLPNVMLESFACGTPVVGFKIGGVAEHVIDNETGFLAKELTDNALVEAISLALDPNNNLNREYIRSYAVQQFNPEFQALEYINLYKILIKPGNS